MPTGPELRHSHTFVPFSRTHIDDVFWNPRLDANRRSSLPAIYDYFRRTGRIDALRLQWKPGMKPEPHIFWDSDVATRYPWEGTVGLTLGMKPPAQFTLRLRIPGWCAAWKATVNGTAVQPAVETGYAVIRREWRNGDRVMLEMDMPVTRMEAHPLVLADQGRVALQRGPLVYCVEDADHAVSVHDLVLPDAARIAERFDAAFLGGMTVLEADALALDRRAWDGRLYGKGAACSPATLRAVPYFAWENRAPGGMAVWLPRS
jgi:DUF1680 family protein